uniref:Uncharacterized protein n=1 Tax=Paenibacillus athensensis TaxID=1967502 RepID=A0A4Y8Q1I9_9BACL
MQKSKIGAQESETSAVSGCVKRANRRLGLAGLAAGPLGGWMAHFPGPDLILQRSRGFYP